MFTYGSSLWRSDFLSDMGVSHGFSTREGGVSTLAHTASMNTGFFRGDSDETVKENINILCRLAGASAQVVCTPQIHSDTVRYVTPENAGEGIDRDPPYPCDGFVTDCPNLTLLVRVADCVPVLLAGRREDGRPVAAAVHAGWRGTVAGICENAVNKMKALGALDIAAAVGPCIHSCCYRVGEDFLRAVREKRGNDFAKKYVSERDGGLYADLTGMNRELLLNSGTKRVDVSGECTACRPSLYHSHRATGGVRGTMGAVICIN